MTSGQIAYEAYRKHSSGKSLVSGHPIPEWDRLPSEIQAAWEAAGCEVLDWHVAVAATNLASLVAEMRHAQVDYFRLRSQSVLQHAKHLERRVDEACEAILAGRQQRELF